MTVRLPDWTGTRSRMGVIVGAGLVFLAAGIAMYVLSRGVSFQGLRERSGTSRASVDAGGDVESQRINAVLAATNEVWRAEFAKMGHRYQPPAVVLYTGHMETPCSFAETRDGPFYCPTDQRIYLDPDFFSELRRNLHAPGDFAGTFVIAHEIGHHVQKLLGIFDKVRAERQRADDVKSNELSVRLELQADFLAGFWANRARKLHSDLVPGDATAAVRAASAMGDDRLQKRAQGFDLPESFRHGTSGQRVRWFRRGFDSGDFSKGDTFALPYDDL